jgi:small subunit ribosomal protein S5
MAFERQSNREESEFEDKVIHINRCAKVVKGGRRFSFAAIVVVGDKKGQVGVGLGKAGEVPEAIKKAGKQAKKNLMRVSMTGTSIPHEVVGKWGASRVLMKPAPEGTGIIASSSIRAILEVAGLQNVLTKSIDALKQLRQFSEIAAARGKTVAEIME